MKCPVCLNEMSTDVCPNCGYSKEERISVNKESQKKFKTVEDPKQMIIVILSLLIGLALVCLRFYFRVKW